MTILTISRSLYQFLSVKRNDIPYGNEMRNIRLSYYIIIIIMYSDSKVN